MKRIATYIVVIVALVAYGFAAHHTNVKEQQLDLKTIELQDTSAELKEIQLKYESLNEQLNKELENKEKNQKRIDQLEKDRKKLEQDKRDLQSQLQAKAEQRQKLAASSSQGKVYAASNDVSSDKEALLAAAGVPESDWSAADYIISRESGWNSHAINANSGACGLAQALPCSKMGCDLSDAICQIKWQYSYVSGRYGGYQQAYAFWLSNHWY